MVVGKKQEVNWVSGSPSAGGRNFGRYYGRSWGGAHDRGHIEINDVIQIETNIYSVKDEKLVWAGLSETFDPKTAKILVKELAAEIVKDLRKKGLVPPEK